MNTSGSASIAPVSPVDSHDERTSLAAEVVDLDIIEPHLDLRALDDKKSHWKAIPQTGEPDLAYIESQTTWKTRANRLGPILGLLSLLFVFLGIPAAAIILSVSNGQPASLWNVKPSVYLAVISGMGNKLLAVAAFQGAIITWWLRALRGTTLRQLHLDWSAGPGFNLWYALMSYRSTGLLALGTICAAAMFADGILLQSAWTVVQESVNQTIPLTIRLAPEVPTNFTASMHGEDLSSYGALSDGFWPIFDSFTAGTPFPSSAQGCKGTCMANVTAAALQWTGCSDPELTGVNIALYQEDISYEPAICTQDGCPLLRVRLSLLESWIGSVESIHVTVGTSSDSFSDWTSTEYVYSQTVCEYVAGVGEYSVRILNETSVEIKSYNVQSTANNTKWPQYTNNDTELNTTLGGVADLASMWAMTEVDFRHTGGTDELTWLATSLLNNTERYLSSQERVRWNDPWPYLEWVLHDLMFRTSVQVAIHLEDDEILEGVDHGLYVTSKIQALCIDEQPTYHTRWKYFIFAAILDFTCVILVAMLYRDYWKLGRAVTISPLEIAKAFEAPLVGLLPSNANATVLARSAGDVAVRYGAVDIYDPEGKVICQRLAFHEFSIVPEPSKRYVSRRS